MQREAEDSLEVEDCLLNFPISISHHNIAIIIVPVGIPSIIRHPQYHPAPWKAYY